jgi:hypothetical protein
MAREHPKEIWLIYRDPAYAGPGRRVTDTPPHEWREEIVGFTTDDNLLKMAHGSVEQWTAAWLHYYATGHLGQPWKPPTIVIAHGLPYDRRTHSRNRTWQVEGLALVEAASLTETVADLARVLATDYRVEGARVMRRGSASALRAKAWCDQYERAQKDQGVTDRPPVMPLPRASRREVTAPQPDEDDRLRYYRETFVAGEVSG